MDRLDPLIPLINPIQPILDPSDTSDTSSDPTPKAILSINLSDGSGQSWTLNVKRWTLNRPLR